MATVTLEVSEIGARGDGIAEHAGERIYLPFAAPGDRVAAKLGERRGDGRAGEIVSVLQRGARQEPPCPHFGVCGGCALQHVAPDAYAEAKMSWLIAALRHRGLSTDTVAPLVTLPAGTRRRARLALRRPRGTAPVEIGFHQRASHRIVDMAACPVLHPKLGALVAPLRALATRLLAPEASGAASLTLADSGVDLLLELDAPPLLAALEALAEFAEKHDLARLGWRAGRAAAPVALRRPVRVGFGGVAVDLPDECFLQASAEADRALTERVLAGVGAAETVADLFAGIGTFTFALAARATVHAADADAASIAALRAAAARAGLQARVTAEQRDLEARPLAAGELARFDTIVFDPPRAGARAQSAELAASRVPRIVAVSCHPASFSRDARALVDGGYRLLSVEPVDSFIWSPHLELVARFER
jgi:23S rRNA (uracil1939-C5)-methyltransferase